MGRAGGIFFEPARLKNGNMRSLWTGAIGFGLVNIPVKLYSATQDSTLDLDMLDKKDHSHIKFKRVNERTGKEVAWGNIVKAYDLRGKLVVLDEKDFERASAEKTKLIEIQEFVNQEEINSMYYETPYYLEPQKNGSKAYALLVKALEKTGMVGLCTFVLRNRESLALIRPEGGALIINKIRFAEEIRPTSELSIPKTSTVKPGELKMAVELIKQNTGKFDIKSYKDEYSGKLLKIIRAKAKGTKMAAPRMKVVHNVKTDIMAQLKESLKIKKAS